MSIEMVTLGQDFHLERGGILKNPSVAFSTYGVLNEDKSNVVLVCHALTANSEVEDWWQGLFGAEKTFDPLKDFIICINNLGSPYGTISPKSLDGKGERYGLNFPEYTIRDKANLHLKLLEQLGIQQVKLLIGGSCGGNIAQEIALTLGSRVDQLVLLCCSAFETPWVIAIHESQRIVLKSDTEFNQNRNNVAVSGLKGARVIAIPFYRSHPAFKIRQTEEDIDKVDDFKAAGYVRYQGEKFVQRYDAHCYFKQLNALDTHNIGRNRGGVKRALSQIKSRTLCIGFSTDLLIPIIEQKTLAELIPDATYVEIDTPFGHDSFLIETDKIQKKIRSYLILRL